MKNITLGIILLSGQILFCPGDYGFYSRSAPEMAYESLKEPQIEAKERVNKSIIEHLRDHFNSARDHFNSATNWIYNKIFSKSKNSTSTSDDTSEPL